MVNIIIVTHGEFGAYMLEAAESIVGRQSRGVRAVSVSSRHGVAEVRERIRRALDEVSGPDGVILFTDMPGGTPGNLAYPLIQNYPKIQMISGVNLYMLVTAFNYRDMEDAEALSERVVRNGTRSIGDIRIMLQGVR